jgi:hypothetical protein
MRVYLTLIITHDTNARTRLCFIVNVIISIRLDITILTLMPFFKIMLNIATIALRF